jgi:hypothetical protein
MSAVLWAALGQSNRGPAGPEWAHRLRAVQIDGRFLERFRVGSPIAEDEDDAALQSYFVETSTFRDLVRDELDIISGIKGAGKTVLFLVLAAASSDGHLKRIRTIQAVNPAGDPVFSQLPATGVVTEAQYREIWKIYVFALAGNDLLNWWGDPKPDSLKELEGLLKDVGLRIDEGPKNVLSRLLERFRKGRVKRIALETRYDASGVTVVPTVEFHDGSLANTPDILVADGALALLDECLRQADTPVWILFDRLDEAFRDHPTAELPALRALLRNYNDFKPYKFLRLKLFIRADLYHRLAQGGYVALTHVGARLREVEWDKDDLTDLLYRRLAANEDSLRELGVDPSNRQGVLQAVLPNEIEGVPTLEWIFRVLEDGTERVAPRNVVDLARRALAEQIKHDDREPRESGPGVTLIEARSFRSARIALANTRFTDTVVAEANEDERRVLDGLRRGDRQVTRAELAKALAMDVDALTAALANLVRAGVLHQRGDTFVVPELYAGPLECTN